VCCFDSDTRVGVGARLAHLPHSLSQFSFDGRTCAAIAPNRGTVSPAKKVDGDTVAAASVEQQQQQRSNIDEDDAMAKLRDAYMKGHGSRKDGAHHAGEEASKLSPGVLTVQAGLVSRMFSAPDFFLV
jgi:hypothetical protein